MTKRPTADAAPASVDPGTAEGPEGSKTDKPTAVIPLMQQEAPSAGTDDGYLKGLQAARDACRDCVTGDPLSGDVIRANIKHLIWQHTYRGMGVGEEGGE